MWVTFGRHKVDIRWRRTIFKVSPNLKDVWSRRGTLKTIIPSFNNRIKTLSVSFSPGMVLETKDIAIHKNKAPVLMSLWYDRSEERGGLKARNQWNRSGATRKLCFETQWGMCFQKVEVTDPTNCALLVLVRWSVRTNLRCGNGSLDHKSFMEDWEGGFMSKQEEGNGFVYWPQFEDFCGKGE